VLAALKVFQLATLRAFFRLFTLRSVRVSASALVLSDSTCESIRELETFAILKGDRSLMCLAGASLTKKLPHYSTRCIDSDSFYNYVGIHDNISEEEQWTKTNFDRKGYCRRNQMLYQQESVSSWCI
jgi:hypothetical protein